MDFNVAAGDMRENRKAGFDSAAASTIDASNAVISVRDALLKLIEEKGEIDFTDIAIKDFDYDEARSAINQLEDDGIIVFSNDKYTLKKPDDDLENYEKVLDYIKKNRNDVSAIRLHRALDLSLDDANDILEELERKGHVGAPAASGERKILIKPDVAPSPSPVIDDDADRDQKETNAHPYSAIKLEHFDMLSNYIENKYPGRPILKDKFKPMAIGLKSMPDGLHIESDKFTEKLVFSEKKIEAEIQKDKTLSVEAVYMMTGMAIAQGMKSVRVNGTDEEKLLLAIAASHFGLKISNENEVQLFAGGAQETLRAVQKQWSGYMQTMHPEAQRQPQRPGPTPLP